MKVEFKKQQIQRNFRGKFNKTGNLNTTENQTCICEGLGSSQFEWKAASKKTETSLLSVMFVGKCLIVSQI